MPRLGGLLPILRPKRQWWVEEGVARLVQAASKMTQRHPFIR